MHGPEGLDSRASAWKSIGAGTTLPGPRRRRGIYARVVHQAAAVAVLDQRRLAPAISRHLARLPPAIPHRGAHAGTRLDFSLAERQLRAADGPKTGRLYSPNLSVASIQRSSSVMPSRRSLGSTSTGYEMKSGPSASSSATTVWGGGYSGK